MKNNHLTNSTIVNLKKPIINPRDGEPINNKEATSPSANKSTLVDYISITTLDTTKKIEVEYGGQKGPEPTRYGDWEKGGRVSDF